MPAPADYCPCLLYLYPESGLVNTLYTGLHFLHLEHQVLRVISTHPGIVLADGRED